MDHKEKCAKEALACIEDGMIIGLGGGSTIKHLTEMISKSGKQVEIVTPSYSTKQYCLEEGLQVLQTSGIDELDLAFDGCDQVDEQFNALKSGGGIHTDEKLIANMAKDYILLVDESKYVSELTYDHPVVLEVIPDALTFIMRHLKAFPVIRSAIRLSSEMDGAAVTVRGNYLLDVTIHPQRNAADLENRMKAITGVVDVSLFTNIVSKVFVASEESVSILTSGKEG